MESEIKPDVTTEKSKASKKVPTKLLLPLVIVLALLIGMGGGYWWRNMQAEKQAKEDGKQIAELLQQVSRAASEASEADEEDTDEGAEQTAASIKENIAAAISSGNTAALEGYMASKVRVIIAASEGVGDRTPAQAVSDLEYLEDAKDPWNFNLAESTLNEYATGGYAQYFPIGAVVGRSDDDKVVSFTFDGAGKINGIFMAAHEDLLKNQ